MGERVSKQKLITDYKSLQHSTLHHCGDKIIDLVTSTGIDQPTETKRISVSKFPGINKL